MLKVLPEDNEYCSLFTGVLKAVVHATANHEKIATGFSQAFAEINDVVARCEDVHGFYPTERMKEVIMNLYAHIFNFLRDVLDWYSDKWLKRIIKSFNESLYDDFQEHLAIIRKVALSIKEDAWLGQSAELRVTRLEVEELRRMRDSDQRERLASEKIQALRQSELLQHLAGLSKELLIGQAVEAVEERLRLFELQSSPGARMPGAGGHAAALQDGLSNSVALSPGEDAHTVTSKASPTVTRAFLLMASRNLEDYFDRDSVRIRYDPTSVSVPEEASGPLREWVLSKHSALLAIAGPDAQHPYEPSAISKLACSIVDFGETSQLPVVSYFCHLERRKTLRDGETVQSKAVISLVYALLRQLFELLPVEIDCAMNFAADRFSTLDGSFSNVDDAMDILESALQLAPPLLYCIIDGLELLDDRSTSRALAKFIALLKQQQKRQAEHGVVMKVLLTTSGCPRCLMKALSRTELVQTVGSPGRNMLAGQPLMF